MGYLTRSRKKYLDRKKQVLLQRSILALSIILSFCILSILFCTIFTYASAGTTTHDSEKYYKSVTIQSGDTLYTIADAYISTEYKNKEQYINEVKKINYILEEDTIQAGNNIIIPYYR